MKLKPIPIRIPKPLWNISGDLQDLENPGLWYLPVKDPEDRVSLKARASLYEALPSIAAVRRKLRPLASAATPAGVFAQLSALRFTPKVTVFWVSSTSLRFQGLTLTLLIGMAAHD